MLARFRSGPRTAGLPVIVISADATPAQIKRLMDTGTRAYVTKPIDVSRFFELVDILCAQTSE